MENREVAAIFTAMADRLAIQGENAHRVLAYRRAAERIAALERPVREVWQAGELEAIPGIGKILAAKIDELMRTGQLQAHEKLRAQVPSGVVEMLRIPGLGPKRVAMLWKEQGIANLEALEQAAREGRLRDLPGVGAGIEQKVRAGIQALRG